MPTTKHGPVARYSYSLTVAVVALVAILAPACGSASSPDHPTAVRRVLPGAGPRGPLATRGRWLVDAQGRVVGLHGFNEVAKSPPFYPAADGFGADDARFLAANGFNVVRLGVDFRGLMPQPGVIDRAYIDHLAETVAVLRARDLFVIMDFHQDGFAPKYNGNGLPDWMAIDDGLPNPSNAVFPLYYIQNPAMQRAFDSFWQNRSIAGGKGLQDYYLDGMRAVVRTFRGDKKVVGYEVMNEPWPGTNWSPCIAAAGCPQLERTLLQPFYERVVATVAKMDPSKLVFMEPFVLFNFGTGPTTIPGFHALQNVLSIHSYATSVQGEENVVRFGVEAANTQGVPVVGTEFGATTDPVVLRRLSSQLNTATVPWMEWAYPDWIAPDRGNVPASIEHVSNREAFTTLVQPYATAIAGTPTASSFDDATRTYSLSYATHRPDGGRSHPAAETVVEVPRLRYADGYAVQVTGGHVVSKPCGPVLVLRNDRQAATVSVRVVPAANCN